MPYSYLSFNESALNVGIASGSYFSEDLQDLYEQEFLDSDNYFGESDDDLIEFTLYNNSQEVIAFNRVVPTTLYSIIQGSYYDINDILFNYTFAKPSTNLVKVDNKLLINTQDILSKTQVSPGLYYVLYNFVRNVAGNNQNKLVIKEISPSRKEIRLSFAFNPFLSVKSELDAVKTSAFAEKKYLFLQISTALNKIIDNNPISENFISNEIDYNYFEIAQNLGLKSAAQLQQFIIDTYVGFDKIQNLSTVDDQVIQQNIKFVGINQQLKNFTYTYNNVAFNAEEIFLAFKTIVTKVSQDRILQKTSINPQQLQDNIDLFVKLIYTDWLEPELNNLLSDYSNKFFGFYKNALNFDDGKLVKILNHTSYLNQIDGRINVQIKLDTPLPFEYDVRSTCWISNISIAPVYFKTNLFLEQITRKVYLNGVNFDVEVDTAYPSNDRYTEHSPKTLLAAKSNLKTKYNDLLIDYNNFDNFIIYSSAELRTKIAKTKISEYNKKENYKKSIELQSQNSNRLVSASYSSEVSKLIQDQIALLSSFDEYESYLFFNSSDIDEKIQNSVEYDINNSDALINQLPDYIQNNHEYADYLKFTAMVGHFFDNIMVYIKKFPKTYPLGFSENTDYPKNFLEELLNSFGWDTKNLKLQNSEVSQYLFDDTEFTGSLSTSYFNYGKRILNRFANNLPHIYKSKGSANSLELITSLFGIPSGLVQIREYGSTDVNVNRKNYFEFEKSIYLTTYDSNKFITFNHTGSEYSYTEIPSITTTSTDLSDPTVQYQTSSRFLLEDFSGFNTFEAAFRLTNSNYFENDKIPLVKKMRNNHIDWEVFIKKSRQTESGILIFNFHPRETNQTASFVSDKLPYFNKNLYSFMITRNIADGIEYDTIPEISNIETGDSYSDGENTIYHTTASFTSSNSEKYVPKTYKLMVNQYEGSLKNFESVVTKTLQYNMNQYFSSGSYYIGNYDTDVSLVGNIDKIKVFIDPLTASDFDEHSYNIDSVSIPDKSKVYKNLLYYWSFDTPIDLWSHTTSDDFVCVPNQNIYYESDTFKAYNFTGKTITLGYPSCKPSVVSNFPYQFEKLTIKQAINSDGFGPNYKNNIKINKIDEYAISNLVPYDYSTKTNDVIGSDSNVVGYYISPSTYLENKIESFIGANGIVDIIGDPKYLTAQNYPELESRLAAFASTNTKYIYPQEYYSTYKFYIDFSIFDYISKVIPNRASLKRGLLIEPSILERNKFNYRNINYDVNEMYTASFGFDNSAHVSASYDTGSFMLINTMLATPVRTDHNTYNFSRFEIPDKIDDRDFIFTPYGKNIFVNDDGFNIRDTYNISKNEYYQIVNDDGKVAVFTASFDKVESIGSGSITGSSQLTDRYRGIQNSGYSQHHLSKLNLVGSRECYRAVSGSNFTIKNGVKTTGQSKLTYYKYTKRKNDSNTTVDNQGLPDGSSPISIVTGFLSLDLEKDDSTKVTGSINISSDGNDIGSIEIF